jgi:hypothetical protein
LRWRGGTVHGLPFVVLVLLQLERDGSLVVVSVVGFVEVALVGKLFWIVLTPLLSKWLDTSFTLLVLTPVLSRLFAHVLVFEFQVGDLKNVGHTPRVPARKDEDGLLLEFLCNSTRTHSV